MKFQNFTPATQKIFDLASENNCWVRFNRMWYPPEDFAKAFGTVHIMPGSDVKIMNPLKVLSDGRMKIKEMVIAGRSAQDISAALDRLYAFEDRIRNKGFKSIDGQVDEVRIP